MPEAFNLRRKSVLLGCTAMASVMLAGAAMAEDLNAPETIVVTGTRFNADAAPAKASLDTTQPQTIINKSYIEDFLPPQSDYVTILAIVPSLTGGDINGPGLSDGGTKNTLRGLPDGMFNMTYDGVPFGDTNGPTHHNISYFPGTTIGSAVVDRGPGNAGTLGAATYGGSVNLFSENLTDDMRTNLIGTWGSFNTFMENVNFQSGQMPDFGAGDVRALVNLQNLDSKGALTGQDIHTHNVLLKIQDQIAPNWSVTLFGDLSYLKENLDDNNGATPAQIFNYGKNFALQDSDPKLPTYSPYNYTSKQTDLDYLRVNGELFHGIKLENTFYTYSYWNHTLSPNSQTQTENDILGDTSEDNGSQTLANGTKDANGLLAYSKENAYRVYGNILRLSSDYDFGWVSGQVRTGLWWETQATHRFKYFYDSVVCAQKGIDPFDVGDAAANAACGDADKPFNGAPFSGPASAGVGFSKAKSIQVGDLGFAKDDEHSDWTQYQPFMEIDIKPMENLTITPGVKFVHWDHAVDAPVEQGSLCGVGANSTNTGGLCSNAPGQNFKEGFITRDTLPFAEVNYKIEPSWSVYAQYAKGIYVPDISSFETSPPTATNGFPAPEETTNYQFGTVYYADSFTFDADVYYIPVANNLVSATCSFDTSETCFENNGKAWYKGVEGEGTYAFDDLFGVDLQGLSAFANGALMSSKANGGFWEPNAPKWTAAAGLLYKHDGWKFSLIDKLVGSQFTNAGPTSFLVGNDKRYEIGSYGDLFGTIGYSFGIAEIDVTADNLLNRRNVTLITVNDSTYQTNRLNSTDQYFFQAPRSFFVSLKVHL